MRKWILFCGAALFLCGKAKADSVVVSTSVNNPGETAIIPATMFGSKTIALQNSTTNVVFLTGFPEGTTAQAVIDGFILGASTNTLILQGWHGALYGVAANAAGPIRINTLGGQ
jgi:hypothetical protein